MQQIPLSDDAGMKFLVRRRVVVFKEPRSHGRCKWWSRGRSGIEKQS
jgi:hypothetical protein